jgi:peptide subunit release factor 1 (eRF1)
VSGDEFGGTTMPTSNAVQLPRLDELATRVRDIASSTGERMVTSIYLDVDGRWRPRAGDRQRPFGALAQQARQRARELGPAVATSVESDLEWISAWLNKHHDRSNVRGLAFFVCSEANRFDVFPLLHTVVDQVVVAPRADVQQLQAVIGAAHTYTIVLVDRQRSRIFTCCLGSVVELADFVAPVPRRHDQRGWSAPNLQRRSDELARKHLARATEYVVERLRRHPGERLLIGGPEKDVAVFEKQLPSSLRAATPGRVSIRVGSLDSEVKRAVLEAVERVEREEESTLVSDVLAALRTGDAVTGMEATLGALAARRVRLLVVSNAYQASGAHCLACGMLTASPPGPCVRCGERTAAIDNVVIDAVGDALSAGCDVRIVADEEKTRPLHGITCVVRQ